MLCPECESRSSCEKRRPLGGSSAVYRRRECVACGHRWSTYEISEDEWRAWRGVRAALRRLRGVLLAMRTWVE